MKKSNLLDNFNKKVEEYQDYKAMLKDAIKNMNRLHIEMSLELSNVGTYIEHQDVINKAFDQNKDMLDASRINPVFENILSNIGGIK